MAEVATRKTGFPTQDGYPLAGHWYQPATLRPLAVVIIVPGGGIPARLYRGMAKFLAARGIAVLTFDYRGIGESRRGPLKGLYAGTETWARDDFGAALATARVLHPDLPVGVVAHSFGAMLVGAAGDAASISRMVFLGPHTGFWGDYRRRWRWPLFLTWHVFMPIVTNLVGFFPGRALGLGGDLPRQFARDWARRRRASLLRDDDDRRRFKDLLARYGEVHAKTLVVSIADDAFAPPAAADRVLAMYPNLAMTRMVVTPGSLRCRRLGHFGFFRRPQGDYFADLITAWLLQTNPNGRAGPNASLPASGTQQPSSAGSTTP